MYLTERVSINLDNSNTLRLDVLECTLTKLRSFVFNYMTSTTPIANWYVNFFFTVRLRSSLIRYHTQIFCRITKTTIFVRRDSSLKGKFNVFHIRNLFISCYYNFKCWIQSWFNVKICFCFCFFINRKSTSVRQNIINNYRSF